MWIECLVLSSNIFQEPEPLSVTHVEDDLDTDSSIDSFESYTDEDEGSEEPLYQNELLDEPLYANLAEAAVTALFSAYPAVNEHQVSHSS